jgi:hypothetical protein
VETDSYSPPSAPLTISRWPVNEIKIKIKIKIKSMYTERCKNRFIFSTVSALYKLVSNTSAHRKVFLAYWNLVKIMKIKTNQNRKKTFLPVKRSKNGFVFIPIRPANDIMLVCYTKSTQSTNKKKFTWKTTE